MRLTLPVLLFLAACQQVPSRSSTWMPPLEPAEVEDPFEETTDEDEDAGPPDGAPAGGDAADGTADAAPDGDPASAGDQLDATTTPSGDAPVTNEAEFMAKLLGEDLPAEPEPAATPEAGTTREVVTPSRPDGWGISLISTLPRTTPPRAVLALSNGDEIVVEPGSFVPSERLVVMAVGADGVRLAHVVPDGDHATIHTETLTPLYRSRPAPRPAPAASPASTSPGPGPDAPTPLATQDGCSGSPLAENP